MKYSFIRFLVIFILLAFTASFTSEVFAGDFTVVIDAGHGGKDTGTTHNGGREKDITLAVALKLGSLIREAYPNVRVLYTRKKDVFIGLQERCDFSNQNKADLFLSIHVNSAPNRNVKGTETYVIGLGKMGNNLSVAMRENKAMLLEDNYKLRYKGFDPSSAESYIMFQVMQEGYINASIEFANEIQKSYNRIGRYSRGVRQDILWVLSQSATPSVLTELGFLTNKEEAAFLLSEAGQNKLSRSLLNAFAAYYEAQKSIKNKNKKSPDPLLSLDNNEGESEVLISEKNSLDNLDDDSPAVVQKALAQKETIKAKKTEKPASKSIKEQVSKTKSLAKNNNKRESFSIKIMSSKEEKSLSHKDFKRLKEKIRLSKSGSWYVYYAGHYKTKSEATKALEKIKKYYKDAHIVKN